MKFPKGTHIRKIPQFPQAHYQVNVPWDYLEQWIASHPEIDLDPDFQRHHVWRKAQQVAFVEFILQGGESSRVLYWNHPNWMGSWDGAMELVDGKQRLEAVRAFLRNEIGAFGLLYKDYGGTVGLTGPDFVMKVAKLKKRSDVLQWYLAINAGGTPHKPSEIQRVRELLQLELEAERCQSES